MTPSGSLLLSRFFSNKLSQTKLKPKHSFDQFMAGPVWKNIYRLSDEQISSLDEAEEKMERLDISEAEKILLRMLEDEPNCVPVLNNLAHMNGRYLSEFEKAVEYYDMVLEIEPDNAWARDERRRYRRYLTYD